MADVIVRKTRKGKRYYARGYIGELDEAGNARRTCKLMLTDREGHAIDSITQARAEAERLEAEAEKRAYRVKNGIPDPKPVAPAAAPLTVNALCDKFLKEYSRPKIQDINMYRRQMRSLMKKHIRPALGAKLATDVTRKDVERLRDQVAAKKSAQTTVHVMNCISRLYRWSIREEIVAGVNPATEIERPTIPKPAIEVYSPEQVGELLDAAEGANDWPRFIAAALGFYCGLRYGECAGLTWPCIDYDGGRVIVARSYRKVPKNGKVQEAPLPPQLAVILKRWQAVCPESAERLVIPIAKKRGKGMRMANPKDLNIRELLDAAKDKEHPFHALRHSLGSELDRQGATPAEIRDHGRWSSLEMVNRYVHSAPERLKANAAKLNAVRKPIAGVASIDEARQRRSLDTGADTEIHAPLDTNAESAKVS